MDIQVVTEENKQLKQKCVKYEKRAKYAVDKFFELKKKEMQLISFGEQRIKSQMGGQEDKLKKTIEKLKKKITQLEATIGELKTNKREGRDFQ